MTGFVLLDVAIGVVFILFAFSLIASGIQEAFAWALNSRARTLWRGLGNLAREYGCSAEACKQRPVIRELNSGWVLSASNTRWRDPDFVPAKTFAQALVEVQAGTRTLEALDDEVRAYLEREEVPEAVRELVVFAQGKLAAGEDLVAEIEARFDDVIANVRNWYQRNVRISLFFIGLGLAAVLNFNVIGYSGTLLRSDAAREKVVLAAELIGKSPDLSAAYAEAIPKSGEVATAEELQAALFAFSEDFENAGAEIGWGECPDLSACLAGSVQDWFRRIISWAIIGFGCMIGAQFWYDLLKSLLAARRDLSGDDAGGAGKGGTVMA